MTIPSAKNLVSSRKNNYFNTLSIAFRRPLQNSVINPRIERANIGLIFLPLWANGGATSFASCGAEPPAYDSSVAGDCHAVGYDAPSAW